MSHNPTGTGPLRDYHVVILGESGDPINSGNPLPVTATVTVTGTSAVADKSAFFEGVTSTALISGAYDDTLGADPTEDSAVAIRSTVKRALHVNLRTAAGAELGLSTNPLPVLLTDTADTPVKAGDATNNAVRVNIVAGSTSVGQADNSTFTQGITTFVPVGGVFNDAGTDATAGKAASARITAKRGLHVNLRDSSGVEVDPRQIRALTAADVVDVSDRAGRLVGVVYGSQGQQLKQTATNFNAQVELAVGGTLIDPRSIRALTAADVVSASQNTSPWIVAGTLTPNNLAPDGNNVGVLPAVANVAAPTYIEGDQVLLSVDLTGALRTNAIPAVATSAFPTYTEGSRVALSTDLSGFLRVRDARVRKLLERGLVQDYEHFQSVEKSLDNLKATVYQGTSPWVGSLADTTATGIIDGNGQTLVFPCAGRAAVGIEIGIGGGGTIVVEGTVGSGSWSRLLFYTDGKTPSTQPLATTSVQQLVCPVAGFMFLRIRATAWGSGQCAFIFNGNPSAPILFSSFFSSQSLADSTVSTQARFTDATGAVVYYPTQSLNYNGSTWDRVRTPNTFKSVQVTATGSTALWTPAAGKKFRLMKYMIVMTENTTLAAAAVLTISLLDSATNIAQDHDVWVPNAALGAAGDLYISPWIDLGNGILSSVANNVLNVNLSTVLATGNIRVICAGMEE